MKEPPERKMAPTPPSVGPNGKPSPKRRDLTNVALQQPGVNPPMSWHPAFLLLAIVPLRAWAFMFWMPTGWLYRLETMLENERAGRQIEREKAEKAKRDRDELEEKEDRR